MSIYHSTTVMVSKPSDVWAQNVAGDGMEPIMVRLGYVTLYLSPDAARALVEQVTAALAEHDRLAAVTA